MSLQEMQDTRAKLVRRRNEILTAVQSSGRKNLTASETDEFRSLVERIGHVDHRIDDWIRSGHEDPKSQAVARATTKAGTWSGNGTHFDDRWAARAAKALSAIGGEHRAIASGSVDVPVLVDPAVTPKSRPTRLVDLLVNRSNLQANAFEYFRQTVRTNNAAPTADLAIKPTSTFTLAPITDRARVIAHLSEPVPIRLWQDAEDVVRWLEVEMQEGVLSALESQVISGSGSGENMTGILNVAGTTAVAYATDVPTTLRKSITALQNIGVTPNAWAINPADAEALDLLKEGTGGIGFLLDGVQNGNANSGNVLGDAMIQRVISPSIPAGVAVLGDWSAVRLYIREDMRLDVDAGGDNFSKNQAIMRAEMRIGLGHLHPASFAIADLTA